MTFTQPFFLWGLLGLLIPIVIHLFYFRKHKKVYFSDVRYLKEIKEERSTIERLKHLSILASRLLALAFLVFAFAQPVRKEKEVMNNTADQAIYIDNSKSMLLEGEGGNALERAKLNALEIVNSAGEMNRFLIFDNSEDLLSTTWLTKEQALEKVKEINVSNVSRSFSEIEDVAKGFLDPQQRKTEFFWISDCQENIVSAPKDTLVDHKLWPILHNNVNNVYLDTMFLLSPVQSSKQVVQIVVKIVNSGQSIEQDVRLSLTLGGITKTSKSIMLNANSEHWDTLQFTVRDDGWHNLKIEVFDNNVKYDNTLYGSLFLEKGKDVLEIGTQNNRSRFVQSTFQASELTTYKFQDVLKVQYSELSSYDLIVLNGLNSIPDGLLKSLEDFLVGGGNLAIIPVVSRDFQNMSSNLQQLKLDGFSQLFDQETQVNKFNLQEWILREVLAQVPQNMQFPRVERFYGLNEKYRSTKKTVLATSNNKDILVKYAIDRGLVFLFTTDLESQNSSLSQHFVFAPVLFNMAFDASDEDQLYYSMGRNINIDLNNYSLTGDNVLTIKGEQEEFYPRQSNLQNKIKLSIDANLVNAGHYNIMDEEKVVAQFSINENRSESELNFLSLNELSTAFPQFDLMVDKSNKVIANFSTLRSKGNGWKICLIFALLFFTIEATLIRIFT